MTPAAVSWHKGWSFYNTAVLNARATFRKIYHRLEGATWTAGWLWTIHILVSHQTFVRLVHKYVSAQAEVLIIKTWSFTCAQSPTTLMQTILFVKYYCNCSQYRSHIKCFIRTSLNLWIYRESRFYTGFTIITLPSEYPKFLSHFFFLAHPI